MRSAIGLFIAIIVVVSPLMASAGSEVPDLKGTWTGDFTIVRTAFPSKAGPNPLAFTKPGFHTAKGVIYVIDKQKGPVFSGTESFGASKQVITGVIQNDNRTLYMVDRYGLLIGEIVASNSIRLIYLENTEHGQAAARGTIIRTQSSK